MQSLKGSALACAKLHTFPGAGTLVQPQTPHRISRDSSITQMWTLLAWELLCLPHPAWLCPRLPCTLCMDTDSGSVISALAFGSQAPFLTFISLPSPSQPGSIAQLGAAGPAGSMGLLGETGLHFLSDQWQLSSVVFEPFFPLVPMMLPYALYV